VNILQI